MGHWGPRIRVDGYNRGEFFQSCGHSDIGHASSGAINAAELRFFRVIRQLRVVRKFFRIVGKFQLVGIFRFNNRVIRVLNRIWIIFGIFNRKFIVRINIVRVFIRKLFIRFDVLWFFLRKFLGEFIVIRINFFNVNIIGQRFFSFNIINVIGSIRFDSFNDGYFEFIVIRQFKFKRQFFFGWRFILRRLIGGKFRRFFR